MLYIYDVIQESTTFNGVTLVRTKSGDVLEGRFVAPVGDTLLEFHLKKGGRTYLIVNLIESITLLDNLELLEQKANEQSSL